MPTGPPNFHFRLPKSKIYLPRAIGPGFFPALNLKRTCRAIVFAHILWRCRCRRRRILVIIIILYSFINIMNRRYQRLSRGYPPFKSTQHKSNQIKSNQIKCWFLRRGENRSIRRKTSRSRVENQQTQPT